MSDRSNARRAVTRGGVALVGTSFALLLAAPPAGAQVVRGTVLEETTDVPIGQAEILLLDDDSEQRGSALSDSAGVFIIEAPSSGRFTLSVRRIGYVAVATPVVDVGNGETVAVEVRMSPEAIPLEPLLVVQRRWHGIARLERFYERGEMNAKLGRGRIFFREDLERMISIRHLLSMTPARPSCPMQILIDGLPVTDTSDLDAFASPENVEGVEIYRSALEVPIEFSHLNACALMLVWTRPVRGRPFSWKRLFAAAGAIALLVLVGR